MDLVRIIVEEDSNIIKLSQFDSTIVEEIRENNKEFINNLAKDALFCFQSVVPINTGQLKNEHIQIDFAKKNQSTMTSKVYVINKVHTASNNSTNPSSPELADILDQGTYEKQVKGKMVARLLKRSKPSESAGNQQGGVTGNTKDWIDLGYTRFLSKVDNGSRNTI